jgi:hypothetical protein
MFASAKAYTDAISRQASFDSFINPRHATRVSKKKTPSASSGKKQYKRPPAHVHQRESLRRRQKREELRLEKERQDAQDRAEKFLQGLTEPSAYLHSWSIGGSLDSREIRCR